MTAKLDALTGEFNAVSEKMKGVEKEQEQAKALKAHVINYAKTVEVYKAYNSLRRGKDKFYEEHKGELLLCENSVQAFKALGVRKLPKVAELNARMDSLKMEKAELYARYKELRAELRELQPVKQNLDSLLDGPERNVHKATPER